MTTSKTLEETAKTPCTRSARWDSGTHKDGVFTEIIAANYEDGLKNRYHAVHKCTLTAVMLNEGVNRFIAQLTAVSLILSV